MTEVTGMSALRKRIFEIIEVGKEGDIYPITPIGRMFSSIITFLGVGMVAIPTGIISAGFVDQYSRIKRMSEYVTPYTIEI